MASLLNRDLLPDNRCFGCGLLNPHGLRIEVVSDPDAGPALRARFQPTADMTGFPGLTHGGAIFTALDCLSTWVATLHGPNRSAAWVLRSANVTYLKPAPASEALTLLGRIHEQAGAWDPLLVRGEASRGDGTICVQGEFKVVPLSAEKFTAIAGIDRMPDNWRAFLSGSSSGT